MGRKDKSFGGNHGFGKLSDVHVGCAAASSHDVEHVPLYQRPQFALQHLGRMAVASLGVGHAGVGVKAYHVGCSLAEMYEHVGGKAYVGTAVYANRHDVAACDGCEELTDALSQHVVSVGCGYGEAQHQRQPFALLSHGSSCRLYCRLRVLCVEYGLYQQGVNAGEPNTGLPDSNGRGAIIPGSVEASNVDLSQEFTNMILAQRGFQASSRVITTSDEMLQELVNLKR